ncbi:MAG: hypothetical protein IKW76_12910 [Clostridia bacterium]|nr:hypothetical protein [Clostridia bacterium]
MHDFQWIISEFLLQHLRGELLVTLAVLLAVLAATAVLVGRELRKDGKDDHADQ